MCGLIAIIGNNKINKEEAKEFILDQYDEQHARGTRGFGLIRIDEKKTKVRRATLETKALIDIINSKEKILMFHHRTPTSTENYQDQTHPLYVSHPKLKYDYLVQHNGMIQNCLKLKEKHEELGFEYKTEYQTEANHYSKSLITKFNDSESFAIELALYLENQSEEIETFGSVAFMAAKINKKTGLTEKIYWGRNDSHNPIKYDETPHGILIASELNGGEDMKDFTAKSLSTSLLFGKKQPKSLLEKAETLELKFKKEPVKIITTTAYNSSYNSSSESSSASPSKTTTPTDKNERPEGYNDREWAISKTINRNAPAIIKKIEEFFTSSNVAYAPVTETLEIKDDLMFAIEEIVDIIFERIEPIKSHYDVIEQKEAEKDIVKEIEEDIAKEESQNNATEYLEEEDEVTKSYTVRDGKLTETPQGGIEEHHKKQGVLLNSATPRENPNDVSF